jgi:hypothetical protein
MLNESKNPIADLVRGFRLAGDVEEAAAIAMAKNSGQKTNDGRHVVTFDIVLQIQKTRRPGRR